MPPSNDASNSADLPDADLQSALSLARHSPRWHLRFPPILERRMEHDQASARQRQLLVAGLAALLVYDLFLINDLLLRPEVFLDALVWRLGILTPYGLWVLWLVHRGVPARWREGLMASTIVAAAVASGAIFLVTSSPAGIYDPFAFTLLFTAGNIAFPLRFRESVIGTALGMGVCFAAILSKPGLPAEALQFACATLLGTAVFTCLATYRIERATRHSYLLLLQEELHAREARRRAERYAAISLSDALTGLPNRRAFDEAMGQAWPLGHAAPGGLALLMIDVDHFKFYNDRYGHPAGDECLRRLSAGMRTAVRQGDLLARLGGEEFGLLMRISRPEDAVQAAERVRSAVAALALPHQGAAGWPMVSVSIGVAVAQGCPEPDAMLAAADAALYEAKRGGRNGWRLAPVTQLPPRWPPPPAAVHPAPAAASHPAPTAPVSAPAPTSG